LVFPISTTTQRSADADDITWVDQREQRGTGHAVLCCKSLLNSRPDNVLVIAGDMPLIRAETLDAVVEARQASDDALNLATTVLDEPAGYGRILRDAHGKLLTIIEDRDCNESQRAIREVNPSYYCFDGRRMFEALEQVKPDPVTREVYVTGAVQALKTAGHAVSASVRVPAEDAMGINSRLDLSRVGRAMQDRIQLALMNSGVTIVDPDNTWIDSDVAIGPDTTMFPFTFVGTGATIGRGCRIGPFYHVGRGMDIEDDSTVGPTVISGLSGR
jgi:bifunctional UDP-N-acetylglucosamine pyrophosphorylase/glucosamine-1-phosphate N-acetyltransferase